MSATSTEVEPSSEKNTRERSPGRSCDSALGEIDRRLMGEAGEHHMLEPRRLLGERLVERGMRVAVGAGPPGRDQVEDLAALGIVERGAARACDEARLGFGAVLGEGVPDMTPVARKDVACQRLLRRIVALAFLPVGCVVHVSARASFSRSSSGSISSKVARVTLGSQGISAMIFTSP